MIFRYLYFLTEEHAHIKKEQALSIDFEILENKERDAFNLLSSKVISFLSCFVRNASAIYLKNLKIGHQ